jgi:hypothetical protein
MLSRVDAVLFFMTLGVLGWAHQTGFVLRTPMDQALRSVLIETSDGKQVLRRIESALARDDIAEAEMYVQVADAMGADVPPSILDKLKAALTPEALLQRSAAEFGEAALSGLGVSETALTGAMGAEAGTAGDLRDIVLEGSKLASGGAYDQVVLGLSVAGLSLAQQGADGARAKAAGVWKVAHRNGLLQEGVQAQLIGALSQAVAYDDLKGQLGGLSIVGRDEADQALKPIAAKTNITALKPFLDATAKLIENTGGAEAVRIAAIAGSLEELESLAALSAELGRLTRGVVVLTGARSVADFKTTQPIDEALQLNPVPVAIWAAVLLAMMALGDFKILGSLPRSRPTPPKRMFRRMPVRPLHSLDGDSSQKAEG